MHLLISKKTQHCVAISAQNGTVCATPFATTHPMNMFQYQPHGYIEHVATGTYLVVQNAALCLSTTPQAWLYQYHSLLNTHSGLFLVAHGTSLALTSNEVNEWNTTLVLPPTQQATTTTTATPIGKENQKYETCLFSTENVEDLLLEWFHPSEQVVPEVKSIQIEKLTLPVIATAHSKIYKVKTCFNIRDLRKNKTLVQNPTMAVKVVQTGDAATKESKLLATLFHPNVVNLRGLALHQGKVLMLMDWIPETCIDFIKVCKSKGSSYKNIAMHVLRNACQGIAYLHSKNIPHNDIKPANLLIHMVKDVPMLVKWCDFGTLDGMATPKYAAPEVCEMKPNVNKLAADIYSLGMLVKEIAASLQIVLAPQWSKLCDKNPAKRPKISQVLHLCDQGFEAMPQYSIAPKPAALTPKEVRMQWMNARNRAECIVKHLLLKDAATKQFAKGIHYRGKKLMLKKAFMYLEQDNPALCSILKGTTAPANGWKSCLFGIWALLKKAQKSGNWTAHEATTVCLSKRLQELFSEANFLGNKLEEIWTQVKQAMP